MALALGDRVQETTTTTGAIGIGATVNLAGASSGFQTFVSGVGNGNVTFVTIVSGNAWQISKATVASGTPNTLTVNSILASSNAGAAISLTGTSTVFCTAPAAAFNNLGVQSASPSIVQTLQGAKTTGTASTNLTITSAFASTPSAGNLIVLIACGYFGSANNTGTFVPPDGFSIEGFYYNLGSGQNFNESIIVMTKMATAAETNSYACKTIAGAGTSIYSVTGFEITNANSVSVKGTLGILPQPYSANAFSSTGKTNAPTPHAGRPSIAISVATQDSTSTPTLVSSGWTALNPTGTGAGSGHDSAIAYKSVSAGDFSHCQWSWSSSTALLGVTMATITIQ